MNKLKCPFLFIIFIFLLTGCNIPSTPNEQSSLSGKVNLNSISFDENNMNLEVGEEKHLQIITDPTGVVISNLTWSSSDENVVTVDNSGLVYAKANGNAVILAVSTTGLSAMCNVTVEAKSAYDSLSKNEKLFFDLFIKNINDFKDPASVRIVGFSTCPKEGSKSTSFKVSGSNSFGGTIQQNYTLTLENYTYTVAGWETKYYKGQLDESSLNFGVVSDGFCKDVSVQKINLALKEYFENKGF